MNGLCSGPTEIMVRPPKWAIGFLVLWGLRGAGTSSDPREQSLSPRKTLRAGRMISAFFQLLGKVQLS